MLKFSRRLIINTKKKKNNKKYNVRYLILDIVSFNFLIFEKNYEKVKIPKLETTKAILNEMKYPLHESHIIVV